MDTFRIFRNQLGTWNLAQVDPFIPLGIIYRSFNPVYCWEYLEEHYKEYFVLYHDLHNAQKVWLIKKNRDSHYRLNQEVVGKKQNRRYIRCPKDHIRGLFTVPTKEESE